jgi:hypothetical protein
MDKDGSGIPAEAALQLPETGCLWFHADHLASKMAEATSAIAKVGTNVKTQISGCQKSAVKVAESLQLAPFSGNSSNPASQRRWR